MQPHEYRVTYVTEHRNGTNDLIAVQATAEHWPTSTKFTACETTKQKALDAAVAGLEELLNPAAKACGGCGAASTLVNHTQFAGTHYWCDHCVPPEDRPDCTSLVCRSPYCECTPGECSQGKVDQRAQAAAELSNRIVHDTLKDMAATAKKAKERAVDKWAKEEFETAPLATQPPSPYKFYNTLEDHTRTQYLLDKLQEEAAEIIQAVSKIRRFGKDNHHPERTTSNLEELVCELEDLQAIVLALEEIDYLDPKPSTVGVIKKFNTLISS